MPNRETRYSVLWESEPLFRGWLSASDRSDGSSRARCKWCSSDFSIGHGGKNDLYKHMQTVKHKDFEKAKVEAKSCADIFGKFLFEQIRWCHNIKVHSINFK